MLYLQRPEVALGILCLLVVSFPAPATCQNNQKVSVFQDGFVGAEIKTKRSYSFGDISMFVKLGNCSGVAVGMTLRAVDPDFSFVHVINFVAQRGYPMFRGEAITYSVGNNGQLTPTSQGVYAANGWANVDLAKEVKLTLKWRTGMLSFWANDAEITLLQDTFPLTGSTMKTDGSNIVGDARYRLPHFLYIYATPGNLPCAACMPVDVTIGALQWVPEITNPCPVIGGSTPECPCCRLHQRTWRVTDFDTITGGWESSKYTSLLYPAAPYTTLLPNSYSVNADSQLVLPVGQPQYDPIPGIDLDPDLIDPVNLKNEWSVFSDQASATAFYQPHKAEGRLVVNITSTGLGLSGASLAVRHNIKMALAPEKLVCSHGRIVTSFPRNISVALARESYDTVEETIVAESIPPIPADTWRSFNICYILNTAAAEDVAVWVRLGYHNDLLIQELHSIQLDYVYTHELVTPSGPFKWAAVNDQILLSSVEQGLPITRWSSRADPHASYSLQTSSLPVITYLAEGAPGKYELTYLEMDLKAGYPYLVTVKARINRGPNPTPKTPTMIVRVVGTDPITNFGAHPLHLKDNVETTLEFYFTAPTVKSGRKFHLVLGLYKEHSNLVLNDKITLIAISVAEGNFTRNELPIDPPDSARKVGYVYDVNPVPVKINSRSTPQPPATAPPPPAVKPPLIDDYQRRYGSHVIVIRKISGGVTERFDVRRFRMAVGNVLESILSTPLGGGLVTVKVISLCYNGKNPDPYIPDPGVVVTYPKTQPHECRAVGAVPPEWFNHLPAMNRSLEVHFILTNLPPGASEPDVSRKVAQEIDMEILRNGSFREFYVGGAVTNLIDPLFDNRPTPNPPPLPAPGGGRRSSVSDGVWIAVLFGLVLVCAITGIFMASFAVSQRDDLRGIEDLDRPESSSSSHEDTEEIQ